MDNTLDINAISGILCKQNERSERTVLLEQLKHWRNQDKHIHMVISQIEKRLAELDKR